MDESTSELVDRMERYCSERERGIDAGMELGMASIDQRARIWVGELRSLITIAREAQTLASDKARLESELAAAQRESDRWRHGVPVEGDFVCPDSLRANELERQLHEVKEAAGDVVDLVRAYIAANDALSSLLPASEKERMDADRRRSEAYTALVVAAKEDR